jgi:hypothetical protein
VHHCSFGLAFRYRLPFVVLVGYYGVGNLSPGRETNRLVYFLTKVLTVLHEKYYVELSVFYYTFLYNECCKLILSSDVTLTSFSYPTIFASSDLFFLQK